MRPGPPAARGARAALPAAALVLLCCCGRCLGHTGEETADDHTAHVHRARQAAHGHDYEALYLLFGSVVLGTAVLHLTAIPSLRALPVTVVLFVLGILFAILVETGYLDWFGAVHRSYDAWVQIDPHLLLFVFLPALIGGDAMTIDTHVARRTCGQCLILAGPGVVIGSLATAAFLHFALPYGWDLTTSVMVGSILSATDPVAVVTLLKDLGASKLLTMQIQGESLLNDGTAIVLFTVTYEIVGGEVHGVGHIASFLLKSTVGAALLGATIGFLFYQWIRLAGDKTSHSSSMVQISLTLACSYWSFMCAEGLCHISGVLSTVAAALVLAHKMWPVVVEKQAMLLIWHVIETIGNTVVFFLAGVLTGKAMLRTESFEDYCWTLVVYLAVQLIRFAMLLCLRPLLNCAGHHVSFRDVVVMTWGGLRGMVGLALAILVRQDRAGGLLSERDGDRILFLVGGVATLTLVVNATTSPMLCGALGITQTLEGRMVLVRNVAKRAEAHVDSLVEELAHDGRASKRCMLGFVREAVGRLSDAVNAHLLDAGSRPGRLQGSLGRAGSRLWGADQLAAPDIDDLWQRFEDRRQRLLNTGSVITAFKFGNQLQDIRTLLATQVIDPQQLKIVREVFLEAVRASYWELLSGGRFVVGSREPRMLLSSVDLAKDTCGRCLADWEILERDIGFTAGQQAFDKPQDKSGAMSTPEPMLKRWLANRRLRRHFKQQMQAVQVIGAFIEAHCHAQTQIASYFGPDEGVDTPEEAFVILESQVEVFRAATLRGTLTRPVQVRMNSLWEVHRLSQQYRSFVMSVHESGVLQAKEADMLLHPVEEAMHELNRDRRRLSKTLRKEGSRHRQLGAVDAAIAIQRAFRAYRKSRLYEAIRTAKWTRLPNPDPDRTPTLLANGHRRMLYQRADEASSSGLEEQCYGSPARGPKSLKVTAL